MKTNHFFTYALLMALVLPFAFQTRAFAKGEPDRTKMLMAAIGKPVNDKKVKKLLKVLGENVEKVDISSGYTEYHYKNQGIELRIVDDTLAYATLYGPSYGDYGKYTGELPYHLTFNDNADRVRQKLGKPDITEDEDSYLGLIYNGDKNMQIDFGKNDGVATTMHYVFLRKGPYVPLNLDDLDY
jgi:hypothetical protein